MTILSNRTGSDRGQGVAETTEVDGKSRHALPLPRLSSPQRKPHDTEICTLLQSIESILPDSATKVIQFTGCREGEGVSSVVRRCADNASLKFGKKVLVLDCSSPSGDRTAHITAGFDRLFSPPLDSSLLHAPVTARQELIPRIFDRDLTRQIFQDLRNIFDVILIDAPPLTSSAESIALMRHADGVVLVLEADRTPLHLAEDMKDKIIRNGGNILGVILNERNFHIPDFIYKRL